MSRFFIVVSLFFLLSIIQINAQKHPAFSSMDVFEMEWVQDPQISPDGSLIVYVRRSMDIMTDRRASELWIINADGSNHQKLTSRETGESSPRWSPDGKRIAFSSSTENGGEIFMYWLSSGKVARLSELDRSPSGITWSPDGTQIAFHMHVPEPGPRLVSPPKKPNGAKWADHPRVTTRFKHEADGSGYMEPGYRHIFVLPAEGGSPRQITSGNYHHRSSMSWSPDGSKIYFSSNRRDNWDRDFRNSEIYSVEVETGKIVELTDRRGPDRQPIISPDGKTVAYTGFDDRVQTYQLSKLYTMNADGTGEKEVKLDFDRSISGIQWSEDGKGIFFQYDDHGNTKIGYTTPSGDLKTIAHNLGGTSMGRPYGGGSYSISKNGMIAYTHTTPEHPSELAMVKVGNQSERLVMSLNADVLPYRTLGQTEEIWYQSSVDQRDVQGWIVKPPFYEEGKSYPLLVENHGGPISNYGDRFSPEIQLYAAAGYVVFYPNPRGSTSYGEEFGNLLYHNYPGDDYHDVMDGVDAILKLGYVDEDSLFVTGGSAGGIMTAWIIGKNNRFRSAAVIKPVMNWISKTLTADNYYGYANSRYPGQPWENPEAYMKFSPVSLVGNIETPTLVMVGTADLRTPPSEAKQLYHALKIRDIETAYVEIPGSYHNIANRPSQLITKVEHILAWFEKSR